MFPHQPTKCSVHAGSKPNPLFDSLPSLGIPLQEVVAPEARRAFRSPSSWEVWDRQVGIQLVGQAHALFFEQPPVKTPSSCFCGKHIGMIAALGWKVTSHEDGGDIERRPIFHTHGIVLITARSLSDLATR